MDDPRNVRHDGNSLPACEVLHSNFEVFQNCISVDAGEIGVKFVIEANAVMTTECVVDRRYNDRKVIGLRYLASSGDGNDVVGNPCSCSIICVLRRWTAILRSR